MQTPNPTPPPGSLECSSPVWQPSMRTSPFLSSATDSSIHVPVTCPRSVWLTVVCLSGASTDKTREQHTLIAVSYCAGSAGSQDNQLYMYISGKKEKSGICDTLPTSCIHDFDFFLTMHNYLWLINL